MGFLSLSSLDFLGLPRSAPRSYLGGWIKDIDRYLAGPSGCHLLVFGRKWTCVSLKERIDLGWSCWTLSINPCLTECPWGLILRISSSIQFGVRICSFCLFWLLVVFFFSLSPFSPSQCCLFCFFGLFFFSLFNKVIHLPFKKKWNITFIISTRRKVFQTCLDNWQASQWRSNSTLDPNKIGNKTRKEVIDKWPNQLCHYINQSLLLKWQTWLQEKHVVENWESTLSTRR